MKILKTSFYILISIYLLACIGLFLIQEKIFFHPYKIEKSHKYRIGEEVNIKVDENTFLNCLNIKAPNSKGAILYLHGNKGMIRRCIAQTRQMQGLNYDVFIPDYRGFGKSDGKINSEAQMLNDMDLVFKHLLKTYPTDKIAIVGYSMGSGMASYLAAKYKVNNLFLVAPFYSLVDLKNRFLPIIPNFIMKYQFKNHEFLKGVKGKVNIIHGKKDEVIPYTAATRLKEKFPEKINLYLENDTSHRGVIFSNNLHKALRLNLP